ncbi:MAG: hypothetical protein AMJ81_04960, partial [Phycisphaerae bacterium SM23_33]
MGVVAYWLWCDYSSSRDLRAELAAIKAAGEPIEFKDLAPQPIPDAENAAELYKKAAQLPLLAYDPWGQDKLPPRLRRLGSMLPYLMQHTQFRQEHQQELKEILAMSNDALALCRQARGRTKSDWKLDYNAPALDVVLSRSLSQYRQLCRLLCLVALAAHEKGQEEAAVEYLRDALALGRAVGTPPDITSHLTQVGMQGLASNTVEEIAPALGVEAEQAGARRQQARALIRQLLDQQPLRDGLKWAFIGERSCSYDMLMRIARGQPHSQRPGRNEPQLGWATRIISRPLFKRGAARSIRHSNGFVRAAGENSLPAARKHMPPAKPARSRLDFSGRRPWSISYKRIAKAA